MVGTGNLAEARTLTPSLTTVYVSHAETGVHAANLLLGCVDAAWSGTRRDPQVILLSPTLMHGGSTASVGMQGDR